MRFDGLSGPAIDAAHAPYIASVRRALPSIVDRLSATVAVDEPERYRLHPAKHSELYETQIRPALGVVRESPTPRAQFFIGPYGSGATVARLAAAARMGQDAALHVVDRELRGHHPDYAQLLVTQDKLVLQYTAPDATRWAQRAVTDAARDGVSVVVESSSLDADALRCASDALRARACPISLHVWAIKEPFLQLANHAHYELQRAFCGFGPFSLLSSWAASLRALPGELEKVERERLVDMLQVQSQDGQCLFDSTRSAEPGARAALERELSRPLSATEKAALAQAWSHVWALKQARRAARPDLETARAHRNRALTAAHRDPAAAALLRQLVDERAFRAGESFARAQPEHTL
jgi:hypothetical protein